MTAATAPSLRTVTFGSLDGGAWGAGWFATGAAVVLGPSPTGHAVQVIGEEVRAGAGRERAGAGHERARPGHDVLSGAEATEDWRLAADGLELSIAGAAEPIHGAFGGGDGFDQLCRVRGTATVGGSEVQVDCLGRRATRSALDLSRYRSARDVSAWFEPDEGVAVTALRPRKAKGHAQDVIVAAVLDAADGRAVADPRLSTTYDAEGAPWRLGLELWLDDVEGEGGDQYPRRLAGESVRRGATAREGNVELRAELLRCHSRGREGAGVYLLASLAR